MSAATSKQYPTCRANDQIGCVIAFSMFDHTPPANSLFGEAAARRRGSRCCARTRRRWTAARPAFDAYFPARKLEKVPINFTTETLAPTPWLRYPDRFTGECKSADGAVWLQVDDGGAGTDDRFKLREALGPTWG